MIDIDSSIVNSFDVDNSTEGVDIFSSTIPMLSNFLLSTTGNGFITRTKRSCAFMFYPLIIKLKLFGTSFHF